MTHTPAINIDLSELQEILAQLPDTPADSEKRKHAITKDDIIIIAQIVKAVSHKSCAMGFTSDEITTVKRFISRFNKGILAVGYAVLAAVGAGIVSISVWAIKHGILEVTRGTGK